MSPHNIEHQQLAIGFLTPETVYDGRINQATAQRQQVLAAVYEAHL